MLRAAANSGGVEERCSGGGERRGEEGGGGVDDGPSLEEVLNMSKYSKLLLDGSAGCGLAVIREYHCHAPECS